MLQQAGSSLKINFGNIPPQLAQDRNNKFGSKHSLIKATKGLEYQKKRITFNCKTFLRFLKTYVVDAGSATGLRVYFACYANDTAYPSVNALVPEDLNGCLTIIFAPTTTGGDFDMKDSGEYFVITPFGDQFVPIKPDAASAWVQKYNDTLWILLSNEIKKDETRHIWYTKAGIDATCTDIPKHFTTEITISFATYKDDEEIEVTLPGWQPYTLLVSNQLTLTVGTDVVAMQPLQAGKLAVASDPENYDTGIPIPPPLGGNDGAGLP